LGGGWIVIEWTWGWIIVIGGVGLIVIGWIVIGWGDGLGRFLVKIFLSVVDRTFLDVFYAFERLEII
jgi:hypothetical protein